MWPFKKKKEPHSDAGVTSEKEAKSLILGDSAPPGLRVRSLSLAKEKRPFTLPHQFHCDILDLSETPIISLPPSLKVSYRLVLARCEFLRSLPTDFSVGTLDLSGCIALDELPEGLTSNFLTLDGCNSIDGWPERFSVSLGSLSLRNCLWVRELPPGIQQLASLNLAGCRNIASIPPSLKISSWLDIADTQIRELPPHLAGIQIRWRGVQISHQVAFNPASLAASTILNEPNSEVRRVMLERKGFEAFLKEAKAEVLHEDRDAGGRRQLLKVPLPDDEDLVCVSVHCPTTGRHYTIRVPPTIRTCHAAVAWTAGFENPADYVPLVET